MCNPIGTLPINTWLPLTPMLWKLTWWLKWLTLPLLPSRATASAQRPGRLVLYPKGPPMGSLPTPLFLLRGNWDRINGQCSLDGLASAQVILVFLVIGSSQLTPRMVLLQVVLRRALVQKLHK